MDITDYFKSKTTNKNEENEKKNESIKKKIRREYLGLLGQVINKEWIDLLEYSHMINYFKSGGTLVNMGRYNQIYNKILKNRIYDEKFINRFEKVSKKLYSHLYSLIDTENDKISIDELVKGLSKHNSDDLQFTKDQLKGIKSICNFLYKPDIKTYGLYGYAGTGKTTLITKLIHYLVLKNYVTSVVFAAPTNKAVNIMKSKFKNDIDELIKEKLFINKEMTLDEQLDRLETKGFKIHFLTIHKLLNYKNDFNINGERIFVKGKKSQISNYDLVLIDECSMIPIQVVTHIMEDIREFMKSQGKTGDEIQNKIPKVLFVGDPAQLPPVNERTSIIFSKDKKDFNLQSFENNVCNNEDEGFFGDGTNLTNKQRLELLKSDIIKQKSTTLQEVVRSTDNKVVGLCNDVRSWVIGLVKQPQIGMFKGKKVKLYKYDRKLKKTQTKWFKKCLEYFTSTNDNNKMSNIILAWTNKQCDKYNYKVRKELFGATDLRKYEVGDILILKDFYNIKETKIVNKQDDKKRFYTSEQIRVIEIETVTRVSLCLTGSLPNKTKKIKYINAIEDRFKKVINQINKGTYRKYEVWKLTVQKLIEVVAKDSVPETYQIYVIQKGNEEQLIVDREFAAKKIRDFRKYLNAFYRDQINILDREIIKPLWREFNNRFVEPFANVDISTSISVHKSQGSNFFNVFVDADDILKNNNPDEAKRCLYTALTRTSNELHILI